jgi:hypothetical protein
MLLEQGQDYSNDYTPLCNSLPRPFCECQLVGTAEKYGTLPDLKNLGLCAKVFFMPSHDNVLPAIFFLMHSL